MHKLPHIEQKWIRLGIALLILVLLTYWTLHTPHGVDGKLQAIGYSFCHQIESHTLTIGDKLLPLCARCTGMYLGALVAVIVLANRKRPAAAPSRARIIVLAMLFLGFVVDGVNSMLTTFLHIQPLYEPNNFMRLFSGLIMGMILANLIIPLWNQTLWKEVNLQPALSSWKLFALLVLCELVTGTLVWLDIPFLFYPVAVLSIVMILVILSAVYSLLWCIILNKENTLERFKDGSTYFLLGILSACLQIGLMDLLRFSLTGSWGAFQL